MFVIPRWPKKSEPSGPQSVLAKPEEFKDVDEFYKTYDNVLLKECEDNCRKESGKYAAGDDRERFLTRWFSAMTIYYVFEIVWLRILGSQIKALEELNRHPLTVESVRVHYDNAASANPLAFSVFPFETWFWFLTNEVLARQNGLAVSITIRGREVLKYLVHCGRSSADRGY